MSSFSCFIVLEGIDGVGKTTLSQRLQKALEAEKYPVVWHREPTDSPAGKKIREFLSGKRELSPKEQLEAFLSDREESVKTVIQPNLSSGKIVIQDRYYFSTAAYQGRDEEDAMDILYQNEDKGFPEPNRVYFLDMSPEEALERRLGRKELAEAFDNTEEQSRIYQNYLSILPETTVFLDASEPLDSLVEFCLSDIRALLKKET